MTSNAEQWPQPQSLADSMAGATRKAHTTLNKLIIARLPDALPPRATDPSPYISGLLHVAPIYIQFEALWNRALGVSPSVDLNESKSGFSDPTVTMLESEGMIGSSKKGEKALQPVTCERLSSMLEHLQLSGLARSSQLRADLQSLTRWTSHELEDELEKICETGPLADFLDHMRRNIESKPHVLAAYAYIFYMALFAGGRFIRASLEYAGPGFWATQPSPIRPNMRNCGPAVHRDLETDEDDSTSKTGSEDSSESKGSHEFPLRFFHFNTPTDGEDLKKEFKKRLADAETVLTSRERADIVMESVAIFDHMTLVVGQLHVLCAGSTEAASRSSTSLLSLPKSLLMSRLRDSVAVAKDRRSGRKLPEDMTASEGGYDYAPVQAHGHAHVKSSSEGDSLLPVTRSTASSPKSVRFEGALPHSGRKLPTTFDGTSDIPELARLYPGRSRSVTTRWTLAVILGLMLFATQLLWRRRLIEL